MYIHDLNPVLINFGFLEIRWYSLAYIFGIIIGWWIAKRIIEFKTKNGTIKLESKIFDDLISYIIISIIVGGRLGYVIFYNLSYYLNNPFDILKIWQGGMSFHGALVGIIIGTYLFSNKEKVNSFFQLAKYPYREITWVRMCNAWAWWHESVPRSLEKGAGHCIPGTQNKRS